MRFVILSFVLWLGVGVPAWSVEPSFFEIRLASNDGAVVEQVKRDAQSTEAVLINDLTRRPWAVSRVVLVDARDVESMVVVPKEQIVPGQPKVLIEVTFNEPGAAKVQQLTETYQERQIAVLVKGRVVSGATLRGTFSRRFQVSLDPLTESDATAIVQEFEGDKT